MSAPPSALESNTVVHSFACDPSGADTIGSGQPGTDHCATDIAAVQHIHVAPSRTGKDDVDMDAVIEREAEMAADRHPQIIPSTTVEEAFTVAEALMQRPAPGAHDHEDVIDMAFDLAQHLSRSRHLTPLVAVSPPEPHSVTATAAPTAESSQDDVREVTVPAAPAANTKPVSWLAIRNLVWSDAFYDEMHSVLQNGIPASRSERSKIIKKLNSKRFFQYVPYFSLQGNDIVLIDHDVPLWALDKQGQQIAHVDLPITYKVIKKSNIHDYLQKVFLSLPANGYRSGRTLYRRVAMQALGISHGDVQEFIKHQEIAQVNANIFSKAPGLVVQPIRSETVMSLWQIDLIDVSRFSGSNGQVHFLLCVCDHFSKYAWVVPLKKKESERVVYHLQLIFLQEGAPDVLVTDNGGEFRSGVMEELSKRFGVRVRHGLPYKSSSCGLIERFNRTIEAAIRAYMLDFNTKRFIDVLPMLVASYNSAVHSITGYAPFLIHRARAARAIDKNWKPFTDQMLESEDSLRVSQPLQPDEEERKEGNVNADRTDDEQQVNARSDMAADIRLSDLAATTADQSGLKTDVSAAEAVPSRESPRQMPATQSSFREVPVDQTQNAAPPRSEATSNKDDMDDDLNEVSSDDVKMHVEASAQLTAVAAKQVAERISSKADKMIAATARRFAMKKNPRLKVSDHVRLDLLSLSNFRKNDKSGFKKPLNIGNFSLKIYKVSARIDATRTAPDMYTILDDDGHAPEENRRNQFYRYELLLVPNKDAIGRLRDQQPIPDYNFGVLQPSTSSRRAVQSLSDIDASTSESESDLDGKHNQIASATKTDATSEVARPQASPRPVRQAAAYKAAKGWYLDL